MCHAPRERVSWNKIQDVRCKALRVTLHVSVWVEIGKYAKALTVSTVTLHVSVWVEMS